MESGGPRSDEEEIVALTRGLVNYDTSNPPGNEEAAAHFLGDYLARAGIAVEYLQVEPDRAILLARLPGRESTGHVVLSGHLDVVPAQEPGWTYDPFTATLVGDRLIGRGTADMKGGLAAMAVAMLTLRRSGFRPRADLVLVASIGEERGMAGARHMAASGVLRDCAFLVVGEPTGLEVCPTQRGVLVFRLTVHGRTAHSSMPELGVSAVSYLARAITALETHQFTYLENDFLGAPSVNVGVIEGGLAPNIVPDRCTAITFIRLVDGQTPGQVETEVRSVLDGVARDTGLSVQLDLEILAGGPALVTPLDDPLVEAAIAAVQESIGTACRVRGFTGATEAGILCRTYGMPMVIVGPGKLEQAHAVDEYIDIPDLSRAAHVYALIAQQLLAEQLPPAG
jgi:acetylornithine deacetylase/succinyl-diaminopimelate desuccinylase family protein